MAGPLTDGASSAAPAASAPPTTSPAAAPPLTPATGPAGGGEARPRRSPARALLAAALVLLAGAVLGAAGYRLEHALWVRGPEAVRTAEGWRIAGREGRQFSGLALHGARLLWQSGPVIRTVDLGSGRIRLLGPGADARATWPPALGGRYAVWLETADPSTRGAEAIAYDTKRGRRWPVAHLGDVYSLAAVSGDVAVWCTADRDGEPRIAGVRIASGRPLEIAPEYGVPVVSGDLVVWGRGTTGPFTAHELSSGRTRPVAAGGLGGELTAYAVAGRDLAWGQLDGSGGRVSVVDVDTGDTRVVASGVPALVGPAFDGTTVVWAQAAAGSAPDTAAASTVMGRRLGGGPAFAVATVEGAVTEVAVSGGTAAWLATVGGAPRLETTELPR